MAEQPETNAVAPSDAAPVVSSDPFQEFVNILKAKSLMAVGGWELGYRLGRSRASKQFLQVKVSGRTPADWCDFVNDFVSISPATADTLIAASWFPSKYALRWGIDKLAALKRITDTTAVDETPEQAVALVLPLADGGSKPFAEMKVDEVLTALRIMSEGGRRVQRPAKTVAPVAEEPVAELTPEASAAQAEAGARQVAEGLAQFAKMAKQVVDGAQQVAAVVAEAKEQAAAGGEVKLTNETVERLKDASCDLLAPNVQARGIEAYQDGEEVYFDFHKVPYRAFDAVGEALKKLARWRPRS